MTTGPKPQASIGRRQRDAVVAAVFQTYGEPVLHPMYGRLASQVLARQVAAHLFDSLGANRSRIAEALGYADHTPVCHLLADASVRADPRFRAARAAADRFIWSGVKR